MERRKFLYQMVGAGASAMVVGSTWFLHSCRKMSATAKMIWVKEGSFDNPLRLLPRENDVTAIHWTAKQNTTEIVKNTTTQALGFANDILAPVVDIKRNQVLDVTLNNGLSEITNIHWHGLIVPPDMDGHPDNVVTPGGSFNYHFVINQRASTNWFHPHPHMLTGKQVFKGLAGILLVRDEEEEAFGFPSGTFEIPLILQDKRLYSDGGIHYDPQMTDYMNGYFGHYVCVNGSWSPFLQLQTKIYRLRIVNGSNARIYNLTFSNGIIFHLIGSDGGLLASRKDVDQIILAPGERLDVLVDFSKLKKGQEFFLQSDAFHGGEAQGKQSFKIMRFLIEKEVAEAFVVPTVLSNIAPIFVNNETKIRSFEIANDHGGEGGHQGHGMGDLHSMHTIGGKSFEMDRVDEIVKAGDTEIWEFDNSEGSDAHPMHVHGVHFQVLSRVGGRGVVFPHESGWKDTVLCLPGEKVRVAITFPQNKGKFLLHCHNLEHEDTGMMLNYQID